jgi:hypothetical protein
LFAPSGDRVHAEGLKAPAPLVENVTWPVGLLAPDEPVSVTVAVHWADLPTTTGDVQDTAVLVGLTDTV